MPYLVSTKKSKAKIENTEDSEVKEVEEEYVLKKLFSKAGKPKIVLTFFIFRIYCAY